MMHPANQIFEASESMLFSSSLFKISGGMHLLNSLISKASFKFFSILFNINLFPKLNNFNKPLFIKRKFEGEILKSIFLFSLINFIKFKSCIVKDHI